MCVYDYICWFIMMLIYLISWIRYLIYKCYLEVCIMNDNLYL